MIKQFIQDSKAFLLNKPKFINLVFLVWFCRSMYIIVLLAYNINNVLIYRFDKWLSVFTVFQYFIEGITRNHLVWLIIILGIVIAIWYVFLYPMWISASIHFLNHQKESIWKAIWKWANDFFTMFELNALAFSFWPYTYAITVLRLITLDVLNSGFVIWLIVLWWIVVLFSSIFRQYAKYIIVTEQIWVFEAIKKSMWMAITNMWITIKGLIMKIIVWGIFYFKLIIITSVPLLLMYFLLTSNVIHGWNERIIRVIWTTTAIIATYILSVTQAFFTIFWHKIYNQISNKENKED